LIQIKAILRRTTPVSGIVDERARIIIASPGESGSAANNVQTPKCKRNQKEKTRRA
jgi:hypothetical protein